MFVEFFLSILVSTLAFVYFWASKRKNYWKDQNVPHIESPLLLGSFFKTLILREPINETFDGIYNHPKAKGKPFIGVNVFHKPGIVVRDPELIKKILVKDFNYFSDRHTSTSIDVDPISGLNLFLINNPQWRKLRNKLSPVFTTGKMKQMFYLLDKVGQTLIEQTMIKYKRNPILEIRDLAAAFTIDSIAIAAFATEANCLQENETSVFKETVSTALSATYLNKIGFKSAFVFPELFNFVKMTMFSPAFNDFIRKLYKDVMEDRVQTGVVRHDLVDALLALSKQDGKDGENFFTDDTLVAQAATFLIAGFETSSSTIAFMTHEIAKRPDVMKQIRDELELGLKKHDGKINYDLITNDLPYLTAVMYEALRLYPIVPFLDRVVVLPPGEKSYSLKPFGDVELPHGTPIFIPTFSIHRDPQFFEDPNEFKPERFIGERTFNEFAYLGFGNGPRVCIGERFALMQVRLALVYLFKTFRFETCEMSQKTLSYDPEPISLRMLGGIFVKLIHDELKVD